MIPALFSSPSADSSIVRAVRTAALLIAATSVMMTDKAWGASPERGIAWPWFSTSPSLTFDGSTWVYNWELYKPTGGSIGSQEFVPMVRGEADVQYLKSYDTVKEAHWLLGFNEPDMPFAVGGTLINATHAAALWKEHIAPLRSNRLKLVAPGISSSGAEGQGPSWLEDFLEACDGCIFDAYNFHSYASNRFGVTALIDDFLTRNHTPVWVTEFNVFTEEEGGPLFMEHMIDYFNSKSTDQIARYSPISRVPQYNASLTDLQWVNDSLTPAGISYNTYLVGQRATATPALADAASSIRLPSASVLGSIAMAIALIISTSAI